LSSFTSFLFSLFSSFSVGAEFFFPFFWLLNLSFFSTGASSFGSSLFSSFFSSSFSSFLSSTTSSFFSSSFFLGRKSISSC